MLWTFPTLEGGSGKTFIIDFFSMTEGQIYIKGSDSHFQKEAFPTVALT